MLLWVYIHVARHIFQACPVWIYTQSNITSIIFTWVHYTNTHKQIMSSIVILMSFQTIYCIINSDYQEWIFAQLIALVQSGFISVWTSDIQLGWFDCFVNKKKCFSLFSFHHPASEKTLNAMPKGQFWATIRNGNVFFEIYWLANDLHCPDIA
jgi:hypothetical protein